MSSQELKKKEKGKEIVTFEDNPSTSLHHVDHFDEMEEVSMYFSEKGITALLEANKEKQDKKDNAEKVDVEEKKSPSSKITPCIFYTSDDKARLRWSSDLHGCFVTAVEKLGGPDKATPKAVQEIMEVEGIALHHVKSHLQKFRLGKCNIRDESDPYNKRYKTTRGIVKAYAAANSSRPQVKIKPKVTAAAKRKKAKETQGSLYKIIERDLHLQRCREAERMQLAFAIENSRNMLEAQHLKPSMALSITSHQHRNYIPTATGTTQQPSSQNLDQWLTPSSYHFAGRQIRDSQRPTPIIAHTSTSFEDFCNNNMVCLSMSELPQQTCNNSTCSMNEPQRLYTAQGKPQFNNSRKSNMIQGFINPYVSNEPQSMPSSSTITKLNDDRLNPAFLPTAVPPTVDSLHQGTLNSTFPFSTTPQSVQTYVPRPTYTYPAYNTLEAVKARLSELQNSSTSQTRATTSHETNLPSSVPRDEEDPVDKYIDWAKVEEIDIDQFDPVAVLEALGFGVNPSP